MAKKSLVRVMYAINSTVGRKLLFGSNKPQTAEDFTEGYTEVAQLLLRGEFDLYEAAEDVFCSLQGEMMSEGIQSHMRKLFNQQKSMTHTSMSVGDLLIVESSEDYSGENCNLERKVLYCSVAGFTDITDVYNKAMAASCVQL